jgi:thioredoxin 1
MNKHAQVVPGVQHLADDEALALVAGAALPFIMVVSTEWCFPCRRLDPVVRKLAVEFGFQAGFVDGDTAHNVTMAYGIDEFPTMLFFRDATLVGRHGGFTDAEETRGAVADFLGRPFDVDPSAAELSFREACARAEARITEIMKPPRAALHPHILAVTPQIDAAMASIKAEVEAGRIDEAEAEARRKVERERLYAPFRDKIDTLTQAQAMAVEAYDVIMNEAVACFARDHEPAHSECDGSVSEPGMLHENSPRMCSIEDRGIGCT